MMCWYTRNSDARRGEWSISTAAFEVQASNHDVKSIMRRRGRPKLMVNWRWASWVAACTSKLSVAWHEILSGNRSSKSINSPFVVLSRTRGGTDGRRDWSLSTSARRDPQKTTLDEDDGGMMVGRGPWDVKDDGGLSVPLDPSTMPGHVVGSIAGRFSDRWGSRTDARGSWTDAKAASTSSRTMSRSGCPPSGGGCGDWVVWVGEVG